MLRCHVPMARADRQSDFTRNAVVVVPVQRHSQSCYEVGAKVRSLLLGDAVLGGGFLLARCGQSRMSGCFWTSCARARWGVLLKTGEFGSEPIALACGWIGGRTDALSGSARVGYTILECRFLLGVANSVAFHISLGCCPAMVLAVCKIDRILAPARS